MLLIMKHFPPGQRFSKKSELFYFLKDTPHLLFIFTEKKRDIIKVYVKGQMSLRQIWGFGCWCFEFNDIDLQKEEAVGFKMISKNGFSEYDFEHFDQVIWEKW